jgi:anthranilate synthase
VTIEVERAVRPAGEADVQALIGALEERPGAWLGCDVAQEGLYTRHSAGCVDPALAFYLDGATLTVVALDEIGARLIGAVQPLAAFEQVQGGLRTRCDDEPGKVVRLLRSFLASFAPASGELALYGALSFDYYRIGSSGALPDDGRRRLVLYFPRSVLTQDEREARWIDFEFRGLPPAPAAWQRPAIAPVTLDKEGDDLPPGAHAARVAEGIGLLATGRLVSLVLSQTFRRPVRSRASDAFAALRARNPYPAMFFLNLGGGEKLFGASPDMQVRVSGDLVESAPVCGTVRRGADPLADVEQARALLNSPKEAAALSGCVDSDWNDKAPVCAPGSLELVSHRRVHFFSTIVHTIAHTRGRLRPGADAWDVLLAHTAPATVAGVPKAEALQAIERLESWRAWYGGAAVRMACDGSMEAFTILRAARVAQGVAEVRCGGNVLVDSDPVAEEDESRLKAETLFGVLARGSPLAHRNPSPVDARRRVALVDLGDPFVPLLLDFLARAGVQVEDDAPLSLLTAPVGELPPAARLAPRGLALGSAGFAILAQEGSAVERLQRPQYARPVDLRASRSGFLAGLDSARLGAYTQWCIREADLPAPWRSIAHDDAGHTLAALDERSRRCVLLFRPDSALSLGGASGLRALHAALDWLAG